MIFVAKIFVSFATKTFVTFRTKTFVIFGEKTFVTLATKTFVTFRTKTFVTSLSLALSLSVREREIAYELKLPKNSKNRQYIVLMVQKLSMLFDGSEVHTMPVR